jgi:hypothetical protein
MKCKRIVGSSPDYWKCPKCGGTEQWFDRTITCDGDGNEIEGMKDRCVKCGIPTDKWIKDNAS